MPSSFFPPRRTIACCAVFLFFSCSLLLFCSAHTHAQQRYDAYREEVQKLFQQGKALAAKRDYKRSLVKLKAAFRLLRDMEAEARTDEQTAKIKNSRISFLYFIGRVHELDGNLREAVEHYSQCIQQDANSKAAQAAQRALHALTPRIQATLRVESIPPRASLQITDPRGNTYTRQTPTVFQLLPGKHTITLQKKGFLPEKRTVDLDLNTDQRLSIRLLRDIQKRTPPTQPPPKNNTWGIVGWVGIGIGAVAVITATSLLVVVNNQVTSIEQKLGQPGVSTLQLHNDLSTAQSMEIGAIASFGVAAAALGLGITGLILANQK